VSNLRVGEALFGLEYTKTRDQVEIRIQAQNAAGWTLRFAPALPLGSRVESVLINQCACKYDAIGLGQVNRVNFEAPAAEEPLDIVINCSPGSEIVVPVPESRVGDRNRGLKVVSLHSEGKRQILLMEGLAETDYELRILNPDRVSHVSGGELVENRLHVRFPDGIPGEFKRLSVTLYLYER
jgi:hypothetical protein